LIAGGLLRLLLPVGWIIVGDWLAVDRGRPVDRWRLLRLVRGRR
jgi:hypothetical protein